MSGFDICTPSGRLVVNFLSVARERGISVFTWNVLPSVTFRRNLADVSLEALLGHFCALVQDDTGSIVESLFDLIHLSLKFFSKLVDYMPAPTTLIALGRLSGRFLKGIPWPRLQYLSCDHQSNALRQIPSRADDWIRRMMALVDNRQRSNSNACDRLRSGRVSS